jgi:hypothetical protein
VSAFVSWEFLADSAARECEAGTATFNVGADSVQVRFENFGHAQKVAQLMDKAFKTGRSGGIAEVRRFVAFHNFE